MIGYSNASSLNNKYSILVFFSLQDFILLFIFLKLEMNTRIVIWTHPPSRPHPARVTVRYGGTPIRGDSRPTDGWTSHRTRTAPTPSRRGTLSPCLVPMGWPSTVSRPQHRSRYISIITASFYALFFFLRRSMMTILQSLKTAATDVKIIFCS